VCPWLCYGIRRYRTSCRVMLESVGPESMDAVVVVDDDIPIYTHSVSLSTLHFDFEFSSFLPPWPRRDLNSGTVYLFHPSIYCHSRRLDPSPCAWLLNFCRSPLSSDSSNLYLYTPLPTWVNTIRKPVKVVWISSINLPKSKVIELVQLCKSTPTLLESNSS
jgi:hypothetical protein